MNLLRAFALTMMAGVLLFYKALIVLFVVWGVFVTLPGLTLLVGGHLAFWWKVTAVAIIAVWMWRTLNHYMLKADRLEHLANQSGEEHGFTRNAISRRAPHG